MDEFNVKMKIVERGESTSSARKHLSSNHTADFGWCVGTTIAANLISLADSISGVDEFFLSASRDFLDVIESYLEEHNSRKGSEWITVVKKPRP